MANTIILIKKYGIIFGAVILGLFLAKAFFTKKISIYNFNSTLPGAETFLSLNKTNDKLEIGGLLLKNKVTHFFINSEKSLNNINVHMAYKPGQKEIKIGVRGKESDPFIYKSLYFDQINSLTWDMISQNGLVLYQKNRQFENVADFLKQMPTDKKIGIYQVDTNSLVPYFFAKKNNSKTIINTPIRGNATAYVLVPSGDLKIKITKQDMNIYDGTDVLNASLTLSGVKIAEVSIPDDGFADKSKSQTAPQIYELNINNAKPGVYKLDFKFDSASNDSVITKIEINQEKVVFGGSLLVWNAMPTNFYTTSTKINASTSWPESIQNLKVNDKADLAIKDTKTKFGFDLAKIITDKNVNDLYKITSPKGNINFGTGDYFSFSPESYFDVAIIKAQVLTTAINQADLEKNFDFILTTLTPIKEDNYWLVSDLNLNPSDYSLTGDKIFFSLEVPELDKQGGSLEVGGMTVSISDK